ncbi:hypothetical protein PMAYCL1PPCAC_18957, partial [Pristionchus mayeri]
KAILLSCGSFNPPTIGHLRMMEMVRETLSSHSSPFVVVEGIFSPVSSAYVHKSLEADEHRLTMLQKATSSRGWMRVDEWEMKIGEWMETIEVLLHHRKEGRLRWRDENLDCFFVCGDDLVDSFSDLLPDGSRLWEEKDVKEIVEEFGIVVYNRRCSSPFETLSRLGLSLEKSDQTFPHQMSSTLLRRAVAEGSSIRYCTPDEVIDYIEEKGLY